MLLITGASGFVGQHLLKALQSENGHNRVEYLPVWRSNSITGGVQADLTDADVVSKLFSQHNISGIIHLAAEARTGLCQQNSELARIGNVQVTSNLVMAASACDPLPYFLHISTDMVFRGESAPYEEDAVTDAVSAYGSSKAQAEELVKDYPGKWGIVRPALVYGEPTENRMSVISASLSSIRTGDGAFFTDEIRTPVYVADLVNLLLLMAKNQTNGIVNAGGTDRVSRYDLAQVIAETWSIPANQVRPGLIGDDPKHAWRPRDISLVSDKFHDMVKVTPLRTALEKIHASHPTL